MTKSISVFLISLSSVVVVSCCQVYAQDLPIDCRALSLVDARRATAKCRETLQDAGGAVAASSIGAHVTRNRSTEESTLGFFRDFMSEVYARKTAHYAHPMLKSRAAGRGIIAAFLAGVAVYLYEGHASDDPKSPIAPLHL
jgi:hypothetical protein